MTIKSADLEVLATRRSQYPEKNEPEFLLVGRSNVGKSSFINTLLNRKNLAHTSGRPGKTQSKFGMMIEEYLEKRTQLRRVFMLVDFRMKPTEDDLLMYNFLKYYNIPVTIVATKADKIGGSKKEKCLKQIMDSIDLVVGDDIIVFSSVTKLGRDEVIKKIESLIEETI